MQNKHSIYTLLIFVFLIILNVEALSQNAITYRAENQPLNTVFNKISAVSKVRFAFDDDYFSKINVSFSVNNLTVENFLKQLSIRYPVGYKLIGGTWVVYRNEKRIAAVPSKSKVVQLLPVKTPLMTRKITYKKARLWDLIGTVIDAKTGNRLTHCQLFVDEYTNPVTNDLGFFTDEVVSVGDVRFSVRQLGYIPLDTIFKMSDGKEIVLKLDPAWKIESSYIDPYSSVFQIDQTGNHDFIALCPQIQSYIPGVESNDFANTLKLLSGFYLSEKGGSGLTTRGASPSENLIILDGIPVLNSSHLFGQVSTLNSKFIHQSFISRGGFGVEYGGAGSGIIELSGKSGLGKTVVDFSANLLDANLFVGIPITNKISVSGSVRKSIVDYWPNYYYKNLVVTPISLQLAGDEAQVGIVQNPFNNFLDITMKVTFQPNLWNEIDVIVTNGYDNQKRSFSISSDNNYFMDFQSDRINYGLGVNWKFRSKNLWYNTLVASYSHFNQGEGVRSGFNSDVFKDIEFVHNDKDQNNSSEVLLKWKSEFSKKRFSHQFGAEYNFNSLEYNFNNQATGLATQAGDSISLVNNKHQANIFFQSKYKLYDWIELNAGIRALFDLSLLNVSVQPRAGIDLTPSNRWRFYYRFGRYIQPFYQTQRINTDFNIVPVWLLSTDADQIIKSYHHIAGANFIYRGLSVNIEGYRMNSSDKAVYFAGNSVEDNLVDKSYKLYAGSGIRQGVDATIQFHHSIFHHSVAYSYSDSREKYNGINQSQYYSSLIDYRHRLQLTETATYSGWIASASFKYLAGKPYLLQSSTIEQFNLSPLPGSTQLDFSLVRQFSLKSIKIETGAVLLNVLGTKSIKDIEFFKLGETSSTVSLKSTTAGISFSPTFFVNLKFD